MLQTITETVAPVCAAKLGTWCNRVWEWWQVGWIAEAADAIVRPGLHIMLIIVIALIARTLVNRSIKRVANMSSTSSTPGLLRPLRDRADAFLGPTTVVRRRERAQSIGSLLRSMSSFVIVVVSFMLILAELGINLAPLLTSAGIAGVALGFGAQNLVKDFLAGIAMILEDQYGVGDVVDLGSATGTVVSVGLRTSALRGTDGTIWYVRNGEVLRVGNSSQGEAVVNIDLPLSYDSDAAQAGQIAVDQAAIVAQQPEFIDAIISAPVMLGIVSMTSDTVMIRLSTTVRTGSQWAYGRAARGAIKTAYDEAGIKAPMTLVLPPPSPGSRP
ncbi:mechanosensitive ion channel family protein [Nakamurella antarctica]|uniref:Mechanosensitive ion channel family protein n=1 Tax=Nakamurella antarctica TaxID=1902245 RepID=A0A3G8ZNC1_9ACTN|nr:mechanosensitive ion channel family protein [Nakamurella antarctica]AZI58307.1 mechanosensitive ion channel family protein [Nakamurella antarctica]